MLINALCKNEIEFRCRDEASMLNIVLLCCYLMLQPFPIRLEVSPCYAQQKVTGNEGCHIPDHSMDWQCTSPVETLFVIWKPLWMNLHASLHDDYNYAILFALTKMTMHF